MNNECRICGTTIQVMCRKGTGICGEICEKVDNGERSTTADSSVTEDDRVAPVEAEPYPAGDRQALAQSNGYLAAGSD